MRFTTRGWDLYAIVLGKPKSSALTIKSVHAGSNAKIYLLGQEKPVAWKQEGEDMKIDLRGAAVGDYAMAFRLVGEAKE